ncbi:hypothetical protein E2562_004050 [Oryza meyeriana var. granulata]|uniref:Uncharacterized protein n=1 Tax=Oryza meyeriana var. granulata TaxID=110450 RepID=A0A6G1BIF2_9ORYZ|nr:hypothetical protein E2562_004050 [Oryza meyeriana var. granulata]
MEGRGRKRGRTTTMAERKNRDVVYSGELTTVRRSVMVALAEKRRPTGRGSADAQLRDQARALKTGKGSRGPAVARLS